MSATPVWSYAKRAPGERTFTPADDAEAARAARLADPATAQDFLHARSLMRALITRQTGMSREAVSLQVFDDAPPVADGLDGGAVSWSRSGRHAFAALVTTGRIGADIEQVRQVSLPAMLDMVAADGEREIIECADEADRLAAFYRLWCAKEAVLKWRGTGLRGGAKTVNVPAELILGDAGEAVMNDAPETVTIRSIRPSPDCVAVLAYSM